MDFIHFLTGLFGSFFGVGLRRRAATTDEEWALGELKKESAAADELIAKGDAALARGIPRDPKKPEDGYARRIIGYLARASFVHGNPTERQKLESIASHQENVLGFQGALIQYKKLNPPEAEQEALNEKWLDGSRKSLEEARKRNAAR